MFRSLMLLPIATVVLIAGVGCSNSAPASNQMVDSSYFLEQEPTEPIEILDAREQAKDGESVVIVGRLGGGLKPWVDGRAAFLLTDTRILPTCQEGEKCDENCPGCSDAMLAASTMVKFLGGDGKVLTVDSRTLLGVKEQQTLVVKGVANRDNSGNVTIAAEKIYVRR